MVGLASIFAVSTYMDIPQEELRSFLVSTLLFFLVILILAIISISVLKLLIVIKHKINPETGPSDQSKIAQTKDKE